MNNVTDDMFKLPAIASNILFTICLIIMMVFTFMREKFFKPSNGDIKARNVMVFLVIIAIINYMISLAFALNGS